MSETYDLYQQGRAHLRKGRAAQATVALEKAKRREPDQDHQRGPVQHVVRVDVGGLVRQDHSAAVVVEDPDELVNRWDEPAATRYPSPLPASSWPDFVQRAAMTAAASAIVTASSDIDISRVLYSSHEQCRKQHKKAAH